MAHGGMTMDNAQDYIRSLIQDGKCTCLTKTNNAMYHAAHCKYRIWTVATYGTVLNAQRK